jgi:hypothetical protein
MIANPVLYVADTGETIYGGKTRPLPAWVSALALDYAYRIPDTKQSSVDPVPPVSPAGSGGVSSKTHAWCGMSLRKLGSIIKKGATGGHGDYFGNECDELQLNTAVPAWIQTKAPSTSGNIIQLSPVYLDYTRASLHTYWGTQYDDINDMMLIVSSNGSLNVVLPNPPPGWPWPSASSTVFMGQKHSDKQWTAPNELPALPWGQSSSGDLCCKNDLTGEIFYVKGQGGSMHKYSPLTKTWSVVGSWYLNGFSRGSAIDSSRNRMLVCGGDGGSEDPVVRSTINASSVAVTFTGLGPTVLRSSMYPGVIYDPIGDRFLVFIDTAPNMTIYIVNAETFAVSLYSYTGAPIEQKPAGVLNSVQWVPELRGFALQNGHTKDVIFTRLHL